MPAPRKYPDEETLRNWVEQAEVDGGKRRRGIGSERSEVPQAALMPWSPDGPAPTA